ncbi:MAG: hypothetical protein ACRD96_20805 [Bryobacteraceae bacterium]
MSGFEDRLRRAIGRADTRLERDLWPRMRQRIERRPVRVSPFDWALAAAAAAWCAVFWEVIPIVMVHL